MKRTSFLCVSSRMSFRSSIEPFNFSFFSNTGRGIDLDCRLNGLPSKQRDHSVVFETASKNCILDSFVDYDGYSISSKGLLPTVVYNGYLS